MSSYNGLLYIFDREERLLSILNNEASESNIFFDDEFKKELNGEWSYKFSVDMSKTKDIMLEYNKVGFYDSKGNFQLFIIHDIEDNIGYEAIRTVYCLHDFQSLNEEILEVGKITGTAGEALQLALKGTKYSIGKVSTTEDQIKDLSMITILEAVYSIAETYGLELYFRLELDETKTKISKRYVDLVSRLGVDSGLTFDFSLNIESIKRKINNNFFTALYGRGKKLKDDTYANFSEATWVKGENPTNKPQGQLWVADEEAVKKYGLRKGIYSNQNISIANTLLSRTWEKLQKVNRPKINYEASVYDLSSITGYENLSVSLGDRFNIIDKDYNINEAVRVIAEYESILDETKKKIELGDPIAGIIDDIENGNDTTVGDSEEDSDLPEQPDAEGEGENTLPDVPIVTTEGYFATVSISWTFENKAYYTYELYASDVKGFTPNENDKIFEGKASAFLHEVEPMEKWYYKVRAKNDYGRYTDFSTEVSAETLKIADGSKYFESASIKDALIGNLKLDRGWVGKLNANLLDVKGNFSVTDGNGKRTMDIDSFGNVTLDPSVVRIGFNGINNRINISSRSMDFTAQNGNKDMLLYNGQVCVYNNMDDTFLSTVGAVLNNKNNFKGVGFLAGANCSNFVVGRDANWSDILTNREPTINYYLNIDFDNYKITTNSSLKCGSVDMSGSDLNNVYSGKIKDVYCYNIRDYNNGNYLFTSNGNDVKVGCDLIFNGNAIMNPTLYTNSFNYTNGFKAFSKSGYGNNMMNNTNWDWQGNNLVGAKIYDSYAGYSLIEECFKSNKDIENDINIKIACEDISSVDSDGDVSYKLDDMFKLLYSKIDKLEKEIEVLKKEGA